MAVLGARPFRTYWAGQTLSAGGNAFSTLALAFAVLSLTRSATDLGLIMLASRAPSIAFTLLGGVLGDRHARRLIMLVADSARTVIQATTAIVLVSGHADLWALAGLQAGAGTASSIFGPAANGLVADLAPPGQLRQANSLLGMSSAVAAIIAVAAAGGVVAAAGPGLAFAIDSATFAASTVSLALLSGPAIAAPTSPRRRLLVDLAVGWSTVRRRRWLCTFIAHVSLLNAIAVSPFFVLAPLIADRHLGGAGAWAAIAASYAVGALAAGGLTLRWRPRRPLLAAYSLSLALAPLLALLAAVAPIWALIPAGLAGGVQASAYNTLTTTAVQAHIPRNLLSRVSSIVTLGGLVAVPMGMSLSGLAATAFGPATVLGAAAAWVVVSGLAAIAMPGSRRAINLDPSDASVRSQALP